MIDSAELESFKDGKPVSGKIGEVKTPVYELPEQPVATLNEPITDTIMRDVQRIAKFTKLVLIPKDNSRMLDWDLWGPLVFSLILATTMSWERSGDDSALAFTLVFVTVGLGSIVVTINAKLIGGTASFFQSVCVLGYCVVPLNVAAIFCLLFSNGFMRTFFCGLGFVWSVKASIGFIAPFVPVGRKFLGVYPLVLFYLSLSWM